MSGSYVGGDASNATTSVNTLTGLTHPSMQAGDIEILAHASESAQTLTVDALFSSVRNLADGSLRAYLGVNVADGTESGAISLASNPTGNRQVGLAAAFRGYTGIEPSNIQTLAELGNDTSHDSPSITPVYNDSCIVFVYYERAGSSTVAPQTPPGGLTKAVEFGTSGTGGTYAQIAYKLTGVVAGTPVSPGPWTSAVSLGAAYVYAFELIPAAAAEEHTGSLALSGTGSLVGAGKPSMPGVIGLNGAGALAGTGTPAVAGPLPLSGSGSLAGAGTPSMAATVVLSGAGTTATPGTPTIPGSAALAGAGSLSSAGQPVLPGDLQLSGGGSIGFAAGSDYTGTLALSGTGALAAAGTPAARGDLALAGSGAAATIGTPAASAALQLSGVGTIAPAGTAALAGLLALTGNGDLAAEGTPAFEAILDLSGVGVLAAAGGTGGAPSEPGHLVAGNHGALLVAASTSALTATNEPSSRLEASHDL